MTTNSTHHSNAQRRTLSEDQFAQRIRCAMNESADHLPDGVAEKLRAARRKALDVRKQSAHEGSSNFLSNFFAALTQSGARLAFAAPALALGVGLYVMSQNNADNYVQSVAEIDTQVLSQDLPLDALLDKGFVRYVQVGE